MTANLGCGGSHTAAQRRESVSWLTRAAEQSDVLFLQEVPRSAYVEALGDAFVSFTEASQHGDFGCRSVVAVRRSIDLAPRRSSVPTASYHGSYVAAASITLDGVGDVVLVSVHAARNQPSENERAKWPGRLPTPTPRVGDGTGGLWDSDFVAATVLHMAASGNEVLAAGDWHEARSWDKNNKGTWGAEYFDALERGGFVDVTWRDWGEERATCAGYQDDHILATPNVASLIVDAEIARGRAGGSDHHAIDLTIK